MRKVINPQAIDIQRRFFEALDLLIESNKVDRGLRGFCEKHNLNRIKYSNIRTELRMPESERKKSNYKVIDIDALAYISKDYNVSTQWLLFGLGKMFTNNAH